MSYETGKLTNRQRAFVEHYLQCWNASEASRRAGYSSKNSDVVGARLLVNVGISAEIGRRLEELKAGADEVVTRLTSHARGSMGDFIDVRDDGTATLNLAKARDGKRLHLIKKLKTTRRNFKDGESEIVNEIEMYDVQAALVQLGRVHGLFNDKLTIDWREKVKQAGYDPDELQRAFVDAIRSRVKPVSSRDAAASGTDSGATSDQGNLDANSRQSTTGSV